MKLFNHEEANRYEKSLLKLWKYDSETLERSPEFDLFVNDLFVFALLSNITKLRRFYFADLRSNIPLVKSAMIKKAFRAITRFWEHRKTLQRRAMSPCVVGRNICNFWFKKWIQRKMWNNNENRSRTFFQVLLHSEQFCDFSEYVSDRKSC